MSVLVSFFLYNFNSCLRLKTYHKESLAGGISAPGLYRRDSPDYGVSTLLSWLQPFTAYLGLAGCILVFVSVSTTWWSTEVSFAKVAIAYGAVSKCTIPRSKHRSDRGLQILFCFGLLLVFKSLNGTLFKRWGIKIESDPQLIRRRLDNLDYKKLPPDNHNMDS
jgi:hypothetical protein